MLHSPTCVALTEHRMESLMVPTHMLDVALTNKSTNILITIRPTTLFSESLNTGTLILTGTFNGRIIPGTVLTE